MQTDLSNSHWKKQNNWAIIVYTIRKATSVFWLCSITRESILPCRIITFLYPGQTLSHTPCCDEVLCFLHIFCLFSYIWGNVKIINSICATQCQNLLPGCFCHLALQLLISCEGGLSFSSIWVSEFLPEMECTCKLAHIPAYLVLLFQPDSVRMSSGWT